MATIILAIAISSRPTFALEISSLPDLFVGHDKDLFCVINKDKPLKVCMFLHQMSLPYKIIMNNISFSVVNL